MLASLSTSRWHPVIPRSTVCLRRSENVRPGWEASGLFGSADFCWIYFFLHEVVEQFVKQFVGSL